MKKKMVAGLFVAVIIATIPAVSFAYFTDADIVEELKSQIANLLKQAYQLKSLLAQKGASESFCYNFNFDLAIGSHEKYSNEVAALISALNKEGIATPDGSGKFDESVASSVSAFQLKYKNDILVSAGLKYPTGYVGARTRAKLNSLYGCSSNTDSKVSKVKIFYINTEVPNHNGPVGCGDEAVALEKQITSTTAPLRAALEYLLSLTQSNLEGSGLYNSLAKQNWKLESVSISDGEAVIKLSGEYKGIGVCEDPRIKAQIEKTALQFTTVKKVSIYLNGVLLDGLMSGKGE